MEWKAEMAYQKVQQENRRKTVRMCSQGMSEMAESLVADTNSPAAPKDAVCPSVIILNSASKVATAVKI